MIMYHFSGFQPMAIQVWQTLWSTQYAAHDQPLTPPPLQRVFRTAQLQFRRKEHNSQVN